LNMVNPYWRLFIASVEILPILWPARPLNLGTGIPSWILFFGSLWSKVCKKSR